MSEARIFALKALACRHAQVDWAFEREEAARIAEFWQAFHTANPASFNGRVFLQHRAHLADGICFGDFLETDFAAFLAWRAFGFPVQPGSPLSLRNAFAMAALRAADGAFLLGEMGAGTANAGKIYFAAGTPDPADRLEDGTIDLAGSVLREMREETGLRADEVRVGEGWTCVELGPRVAYMRDVRIDRPATETRALMLSRMQAMDEHELADIHIVRGPRDIDEARMPPFQVAFLRWAFTAYG